MYQINSYASIPIYCDQSGYKAKIISGEVFGVKGPVLARTPTYFIDFIFDKVGLTYEHVIPAGWNSLIVCYEGSLKVQQ